MTPEEIKELQRQQLERAGAFEAMVNSKGWEHVNAWFRNHMEQFTTKSITQGYASMEEFQYARGYVNALRELLINVQSDLEQLATYRKTAGTTDTVQSS